MGSTSQIKTATKPIVIVKSKQNAPTKIVIRRIKNPTPLIRVFMSKAPKKLSSPPLPELTESLRHGESKVRSRSVIEKKFATNQI